MAEITKELGRIPVSRGNYQTTTEYYKDNIVQYKRGSYQVVSESPIIGIPPTNDKNVVNPGWTLFAGTLDAQDVVNQIKEQEAQSIQAVADREAEILAKSDAAKVSFDNTGTSLSGTNVQDALEETDGKINQLKNAGYFYAGIATPTTNPSTPDGHVFYIANGKGIYTNFGGIEVTEDVVVVLYYDTIWHKEATGIASNDKLTDLDSKKVDKEDNKSLINSGYSDSINIIEDSYFSDVVTDSKGRIVEGTKSDGTKYIYKIKSETISNLEKSVESRVLKEKGKSLIIQDFANSLNVEDNKEFIEVSLDTKGRIIKALKRDGTSVFANIDSPTINDIYNKLKVVDITSINQWTNKTALFYGDSVTAQSNHGAEQPFENENSIWATKVCKVLNFAKYYCRGIGGATWSPMNKIAYIDAEGRPQSNTITNYTKETAPVIEGYTIVDGGMACWERITNQIPESIRLSIDMVFIFCHNQEASSFTPSFSKLNVWDTLWMESPLNIYGGDYDITDCGNAIVSAVMKLQTWCPNARIVIGTGVSGRGKNDGSISTDLNTSIELQQKQEITKEIANTLSIPCVDVWGTDGINVFNRNRFIADGVHPTQDGGQMMAKAIIGGLKNIYPINY